jgi:hypothetical protein
MTRRSGKLSIIHFSILIVGPSLKARSRKERGSRPAAAPEGGETWASLRSSVRVDLFGRRGEETCQIKLPGNPDNGRLSASSPPSGAAAGLLR